nr:MAG TPA: hypothetical protein [Bacteriophage sp.]
MKIVKKYSKKFAGAVKKIIYFIDFSIFLKYY